MGPDYEGREYITNQPTSQPANQLTCPGADPVKWPSDGRPMARAAIARRPGTGGFAKAMLRGTWGHGTPGFGAGEQRERRGALYI